MAKKNNLKSVRLSDQVMDYVINFEGDGFNQKFEKNGQPIAEKPMVARDFIEFRTARGFPLDGFKDLAGNPQSLSQFKDKLVIVDVWGSWSATCQRSAPLMAKFQAEYNKPESRIRFVSISNDKNPKRVTRFVQRTKLPETIRTTSFPRRSPPMCSRASSSLTATAISWASCAASSTGATPPCPPTSKSSRTSTRCANNAVPRERASHP